MKYAEFEKIMSRGMEIYSERLGDFKPGLEQTHSITIAALHLKLDRDDLTPEEVERFSEAYRDGILTGMTVQQIMNLKIRSEE